MHAGVISLDPHILEIEFIKTEQGIGWPSYTIHKQDRTFKYQYAHKESVGQAIFSPTSSSCATQTLRGYDPNSPTHPPYL